MKRFLHSLSTTLFGALAAVMVCLPQTAGAVDGFSIGDEFTLDGITYRVTLASSTVKRCRIVSFDDKQTNFVYRPTIPYGGFNWNVQLSGKPVSDSPFLNNKTLVYIYLYDYYDATNNAIAEEFFKGCTALVGVYVPSSCTTVGKSAFEGCEKLEHVWFLDPGIHEYDAQFTTIGERAFYNCKQLKSFSFDKTLNIGKNAFANVAQFDEINLKNVEQVNDYAFSNTKINTLIFDGDGTIDKRTFLTPSAFANTTVEKIIFRSDEAVSTNSGNTPFYNAKINTIATEGGAHYISGYLFESIYGGYYGGQTVTIDLASDMDTIGSECFSAVSNLSIVFKHNAPNFIYPNTFSLPLEHLYTSCDDYATIRSQVGAKWSMYKNFAPNGLEIKDNPYAGFLNSLNNATDFTKCDLAIYSTDAENLWQEYGFNCSGYYSVRVDAKDEWRFTGWSDGNTDNPRFFDRTNDVSAAPSPEFINENDIINMFVEVVLLDADGNEKGFMKGSSASANVVFYDQNRNMVEAMSGFMNTFTATYIHPDNTEAYITAELNDTHYDFVRWEIGDYLYMQEEELAALKPIMDSRLLVNGETHALTIPLTYSNVTIGGETFNDFQAFPHQLRVYFQEQPKYKVTFGVNDPAMGSLGGSESIVDEYYYGGMIFMLTAQANDGYKFVNWSDGVTESVRVLTLSQDTTVIANFARSRFNITVLSADETMGTVTGGGSYNENETATLTATANEGYEFLKWSDGNTDNPRNITVTADASFVATFKVKEVTPPTPPEEKTYYTVALIANPTEGGTFLGAGKYEEGTTAIIAANPAAGYEFVNWNDGVTDAARSIVVDKDYILVANFHRIGTGIDEVPDNHVRGTKELRNGILIIRVGEKEYNVLGVELR